MIWGGLGLRRIARQPPRDKAQSSRAQDGQPRKRRLPAHARDQPAGCGHANEPRARPGQFGDADGLPAPLIRHAVADDGLHRRIVGGFGKAEQDERKHKGGIERQQRTESRPGDENARPISISRLRPHASESEPKAGLTSPRRAPR